MVKKTHLYSLFMSCDSSCFSLLSGGASTVAAAAVRICLRGGAPCVADWRSGGCAAAEHCHARLHEQKQQVRSRCCHS